ncbi:hypothetical protein H1220_05785 [Carnobacteriaceae bacterium zg-84]|uniref:CAP domain-containing protein n=1 Tax=Granulicatella sp. zg-84 TaxID=2678503 RepID=UPI0013BEF198|nr:CAP domain-containing protein [Granulicatella sp. zg-84]NEW65440.1 hypothetical protein [Granulicatella sp. zg-84]QMI85236.1 hypothetical protein H1220_05785 [Carnobacteriaceae bacterium zg-84]
MNKKFSKLVGGVLFSTLLLTHHPQSTAAFAEAMTFEHSNKNLHAKLETENNQTFLVLSATQNLENIAVSVSSSDYETQTIKLNKLDANETQRFKITLTPKESMTMLPKTSSVKETLIFEGKINHINVLVSIRYEVLENNEVLESTNTHMTDNTLSSTVNEPVTPNPSATNEDKLKTEEQDSKVTNTETEAENSNSSNSNEPTENTTSNEIVESENSNKKDETISNHATSNEIAPPVAPVTISTGSMKPDEPANTDKEATQPNTETNKPNNSENNTIGVVQPNTPANNRDTNTTPDVDTNKPTDKEDVSTQPVENNTETTPNKPAEEPVQPKPNTEPTSHTPDTSPVVTPIHTTPTVNPTSDLSSPKTYTIDLGKGKTGTVTGYYDSNLTQELITLLNQHREKQGRKPLSINTHLSEGTLLRAREFAYNAIKGDTNYHTRPNGLAYSSAFSTTNIGENLVMQYPTAQGLMGWWQHSYNHNANMLNPNWTSVSIAVFVVNGQNYAIQIFN